MEMWHIFLRQESSRRLPQGFVNVLKIRRSGMIRDECGCELSDCTGCFVTAPKAGLAGLPLFTYRFLPGFSHASSPLISKRKIAVMFIFFLRQFLFGTAGIEILYQIRSVSINFRENTDPGDHPSGR